MTRPKKWHLDVSGEDAGIILKNTNGPLKKPNATCALGEILKVTVATGESKGKLTEDEALLVSIYLCEFIVIFIDLIKTALARYYD